MLEALADHGDRPGARCRSKHEITRIVEAAFFDAPR
jgi:hypothetical protein